MSDLNPEEHPFGETAYRNYDPEEINSADEAAEALEWIADENAKKGRLREAEVFRDAAGMVRDCLGEDTDQ